jgi:hypothetical protein
MKEDEMNRRKREDHYRYLSEQLGIPADVAEVYLIILDDASLEGAISELQTVGAYKKRLREIRDQTIRLRAEYRAAIKK